MKKAEVQFNLIFVIVAGVMILAFFLFFTTKYIDLKEKQEAAKISGQIDNLLLGLKFNTQYKELDVPNFNLNVNCGNITINNRFTKDLDYVFFATNGTSKKLTFWVKEVEKGFRIDNVVFIIDNTKKYYSDREFFPDFVNVNEDYDVGVFFNSCPNNNKKVICVDGNNINYNGESFYSFDDALIYGAAFGNFDNFKCSYEKLVDKLIILYDIYLKKNEGFNDGQEIRSQISTLLSENKNKIVNGNYDVDNSQLDLLNTKLSNYELEVLY
ncbi:hypothetical protein J4438_01400 [Candidatus Woesearchaeota archaeon]|nr:hypothetical protein [Candidatus Woesearchaeota archaeon]